jgi:hypothetical protein
MSGHFARPRPVSSYMYVALRIRALVQSSIKSLNGSPDAIVAERKLVLFRWRD